MSIKNCAFDGSVFSQTLLHSSDLSTCTFHNIKFDTVEMSGLDFPKGFSAYEVKYIE
jgi:uncharacterized protein YjbI with pentapeptide repeats